MAAVHPVNQNEAKPDFGRTGPGTLAGRYMRQFWQPVFNSDELPRGRATPVRIMSEDFTLYRGQSGAAHVVAQRCAHRSTQLNTGWVEGDEIRCLYHGWKFDGKGRCVERPQEKTPPGAHDAIAAYPTREYLGLIFAYFWQQCPDRSLCPMYCCRVDIPGASVIEGVQTLSAVILQTRQR